jgi:tRNA(Ile)-lysidine synthase
MGRAAPLPERFLRHLSELRLADGQPHLLVAVSGGLDSVVLLHLLNRASGSLNLALTAAHLDHALRPDSSADAEWVAALCHEWGVPLISNRLDAPPGDEAEAREARHAFLGRAAGDASADFVVTGHHADDQAETVLFRALRGTGLRGLGGIRVRGRRGVVHPLLPFWRSEIESYAKAEGLAWRTDATNAGMDRARNRIRHSILPEIERHIAPGARRSLVALAELAREAEAALDETVRSIAARLVREEHGAVLMDRSGLADCGPTIAARILRSALRRLEVTPDRAGTHAMLQFITDSPSGRQMPIATGVTIRVEFDTVRIERDAPIPDDIEMEISVESVPGDESRMMRIGGAEYTVRCSSAAPSADQGGNAGAWTTTLAIAEVRGPLRFRRWRRGDRVRTPGGSKSLGKFFVEQRVPRSSRSRMPVLVDADEQVLWVGGVLSAARSAPDTADLLTIRVEHA